MIAALLALMAVVLVVYAPALNGSFLWDDDGHITRRELRDLDGLARIWFDLGATQQYYPVTHSVFWVEHRLWGDATPGYHVVNVVLHALSAWLFALVLRRLNIPGAFLAAAIFALHPVHVESVAWISELKNTLSTMLCLAAALLYLDFDESRTRKTYALSLFIFVLALLSKSVTATLPAAMLVVFWWRRGALSGKRDVVPLLPFCVIGIAAGLFTAWVEREYIGAQGAEFALPVWQRFFLAARIVWFYLGKLLWPAGLVFTYPRWNLHEWQWWHYGYLPAITLLLALAWSVRRRWRGPLAALLIFGGTLVPVLGFFDIYPFVFSFVADHFQYLASLAMIAAVAAGMVLLSNRVRRPGRTVLEGGYALLLLALAGMTWSQSRNYRDPETLYRSILEKNPGSWMAHDNLSVLSRAAGRIPEALAHARAAIGLKPTHSDAHNNLGAALATQGDIGAAKAEFEEAIRLEPKSTEARANLARVNFLEGDTDAAIAQLRMVLRMADINPQVHFTLGQALIRSGDTRAALEHFRRALEQQPRWDLPLNELLRISRTAADRSLRESASAIYRQHAN